MAIQRFINLTRGTLTGLRDEVRAYYGIRRLLADQGISSV
jgi:hypothetical protein